MTPAGKDFGVEPRTIRLAKCFLPSEMLMNLLLKSAQVKSNSPITAELGGSLKIKQCFANRVASRLNASSEI